ncbi:MAG: hypothetical protein LC119_02260 [Burkholderiales bacterium]|nr:hypothetical protein [Burkholderiales bacterium]
MNPIVGWSLAVLAVAIGYARFGWKGVLLAVTMVVFWLLLQFGRALRTMRDAAARPVGAIDNAVMLHAQLRPGMRLLQILPLAGSLGEKVADDPETFVWTDGGGDRVRVELRRGRCTAVRLERAAGAP